MRVTVVTAVLNARQDLIRTRQSVLKQRDVDVQHVVIDGGSTDGTAELLSDWSTDKAFSFKSEPDSGVYAAFNKGLKLADGDLIGFLNAGDVYHDESVLSDIVAELSDPQVDLVFGNIDITRRGSVDAVVRRYGANGFSPERLVSGFMPPHPSIYAKRRVYDAVGKFSEGFRIAGDFEWSIRAFLKLGVCFRHIDRVFVRMPAGGLSNNGFSSIIRNTAEMHQALSEHELPASWLKLAMRLPRKWLLS